MLYAFAEIISVYGNEGAVSQWEDVDAALRAAWERTGAWVCAVAANEAGLPMKVIATMDAGGDISWTD